MQSIFRSASRRLPFECSPSGLAPRRRAKNALHYGTRSIMVPLLPNTHIVKDISPNAWQHVHLIGAFDFEQTESQIDINALAARYDDPNFWNRALIEAPDDPLA